MLKRNYLADLEVSRPGGNMVGSISYLSRKKHWMRAVLTVILLAAGATAAAGIILWTIVRMFAQS